MLEPKPAGQSPIHEATVNLLTAAFAWLLLLSAPTATFFAMHFFYSPGQPLLTIGAAVLGAAAFLYIFWNFWNIIGAAAAKLDQFLNRKNR